MPNFNNVAEAYGFWRNTSADVLEARASAIKADIAGNPDANVSAYTIELEGILKAREEKGEEKKPEPAPAAVTATAGNGGSEDEAGSKAYRSAFYKALTNRPLTADERAAYERVNAEKRADAFGSLSSAAAVIPTTTLDEIVTKARKKGGILSVSRAFNMPSNIAIPVATPTDTASWHTEGAAVEAEAPALASVAFAANEIMRIISISAAVDTMSIDALESYLSDELSESVMSTVAKAMVDGTGSGQGTGIISGITWNATNSVTVAKSANLTYANVVAAIAMLKRGYSNGARFAMNNATLYSDVYGLVDGNGRPLFVADPVEKGKGRILGFEVVVDDFMSDHDILFGNFAYNGWNMPSGIALDVSRESSFRKGLVDFRALAIADCQPIVEEAFVRITKATA